MSNNDDGYIRDFVKRALAGVKVEAPDPNRSNGTREALLSLHQTVMAGGNVQDAWQTCVKNIPDLNQYTPQPPRFKLYTAAQMIDIKPLEFLVPGMIVANGFNVMFGQPETGKSLISLGIAENLSQAMAVLYVAAEGIFGIRLRCEALEARNKRAIGNMHFLAQPVNLLDKGETTVFIEEVVKVVNPRLIVFDTLARCMVGGDENSSRDMGIVIDNCLLVQQANAAVLMIHHTGKSGATERGSSALRGAADSMVEVYKDDDLITVESSKLKDGDKFPAYHVKLVKFASSVAAVKSDKVSTDKSDKLTATQYSILETLALEPFLGSGARTTALMNTLQPRVADRTFYKAIDKLMRYCMVEKAGRYEPWKITDEGFSALRARYA